MSYKEKLVSSLCRIIPSRSDAGAGGTRARTPMPHAKDFDARVAIAIAGRMNVADLPKVRGAGRVATIDGERWQLMHNGLWVLADGYYGAWMTRLIAALQGHHEPQEERVFHEVIPHLRKAPVMLELGAYWSYYSMWLKLARPDARVLLVEPDLRNIAVGLRNFKRNQLQGTFIPGFIGAEARGPEPRRISGEPELQTVVPTFTVDQLRLLAGLDRIDLLHADIQKAELDMLHGAADALRRRQVDFLFISTHSDELHRACWQYLERLGYELIVEHDKNDSFSNDGLIVAARPDVPSRPTPTISRRTAADWQPDTSADRRTRGRS
jgi:FkbM family methyltransferase